MIRQSRFDMLAKCGYVARGIVFLLVAGLALFSGVAPETKSALATLLEQPLGRVWVALIGLGLLGFVAWRLAQSVADTDGHGFGAKAVAIRLALLGSAVTYLALASYALGHALFPSGGREGAGEKGLAHWIMSQPFGFYLAIAVGLGFVGGGAITASKGITGKFERYLRLPAASKGFLRAVCIYGLVSRGVVFAVTGMLFVYAGFRVDPEQAGSMGDAMAWVRQLPYGAILYFAAAAGLAAFGIYNLVEARYRVIHTASLATTKRSMPAIR